MYGTRVMYDHSIGYTRYLNVSMAAPGQHLSKRYAGPVSNCREFQVYADVPFHFYWVSLQKQRYRPGVNQ